MTKYGIVRIGSKAERLLIRGEISESKAVGALYASKSAADGARLRSKKPDSFRVIAVPL